MRAALRWLAANPASSKSADVRLLEQAGSALAGAALQRPVVYLPALRALRQMITDVRAGRAPAVANRSLVERALADMLPAPSPVPLRPSGPDRLAQRYFQELSR